ncbi:hypothetical protein B0H14DRAFT_554036 [Mycena olivaceomarginata]|nr:hypothetical protein B0H14DRAFT_554036 [Mycena olivaceomarginata]
MDRGRFRHLSLTPYHRATTGFGCVFRCLRICLRASERLSCLSSTTHLHRCIYLYSSQPVFERTTPTHSIHALAACGCVHQLVIVMKSDSWCFDVAQRMINAGYTEVVISNRRQACPMARAGGSRCAYRSHSHTRTGSTPVLVPVSLGYILEMSPHGWRFVPETMRIVTARNGAEWWGASGVFAPGHIRILVPEPLPNDHLPRKLVFGRIVMSPYFSHLYGPRNRPS